MKFLKFRFFNLFALLLLFCNVQSDLNEAKGTENILTSKYDPHLNKYPPLVLIEKNQCAFIERSPFMISEENLPIAYLYFCPLQDERDLKLKKEFCEDVHCVFLVKTTDTYDEEFRCQNEILPSAFQNRENETDLFFPIDIAVMNIFPVQKQTTFIGKFSRVFKHYLTSEGASLSLGEQSDERNSEYKILWAPLYLLMIDEQINQTNYSIHNLPYMQLPAEKFAIPKSHVDVNDIHTLRKDYFMDFDLELSYRMYNESPKRETSGESEITAQKFVPSASFDFEVWRQSTESDANIAPISIEYVELWNSMNFQLQQATKVFKEEVVIYTGIINEVINEVPKLTFPLIRVSYPFEELYPHNILISIPKIWYRIVGPRNSSDSVIIILLNDPRDSRFRYKIKDCSMDNSRWQAIFKELEERYFENVIFCKVNQKIIFKDEHEALLPEDSILDPGRFIIESVFE